MFVELFFRLGVCFKDDLFLVFSSFKTQMTQPKAVGTSEDFLMEINRNIIFFMLLLQFRIPRAQQL